MRDESPNSKTAAYVRVLYLLFYVYRLDFPNKVGCELFIS